MRDRANMHTHLLMLLLLATQKKLVALGNVCHPHNHLVRECPTPLPLHSVTSSLFNRSLSICEAGLMCIQFCQSSCGHCDFMVLSKFRVSCAALVICYSTLAWFKNRLIVCYGIFPLHACTYSNPMFLYLGLLQVLYRLQ